MTNLLYVKNNKSLFCPATEFNFFLSKSTILRPTIQDNQYFTLLGQSVCRYVVH